MKNYSDSNIDSIIAELSGEVIKNNNKKSEKIDLYCEDVIARHILRNWLSQFNSRFKIQSCSLGAESYLELIRVKMTSIRNSIVVLDIVCENMGFSSVVAGSERDPFQA